MAKSEPQGMEQVEPQGLSEERASRLARLGAACDCVCSGNQHAGANGAGKNSDTCGCYCALQNDNANFSAGNNKLTTQVLHDVIAYLRDYSK